MSRRPILYLSFMVMESLSLFAFDAILAAVAGHSIAPASFLAFLAAEVGGFLLALALSRFTLSTHVLVAAGAVISFVALVTIAGLAVDAGSLPPGWAGVGRFLHDPGGALSGAEFSGLAGIVLLVVVWARGVVISQERLEHERVLRSFSFGMVVLFIGLTFGERSSARDAVNGSAIPILAAGLLALALVNLRDAYGEHGEPRGSSWTLITAGTIAGLVVVGAAVGALPLAPLRFLYVHAVAPALDVGVTIFAWTIVIIGYPFAWLTAVILERLSRGRGPGTPGPPRAAAGEVAQRIHGAGTSGFVGVLIFAGKLFVVALALVLLIYGAYLLFRRLHRPPADDEERTSLQDEGGLREDLLALLRRLRRQAAPNGRPTDEPFLPSSIQEVRRLYLRVLDRAASRGHPRRPATTPLEFTGELERAFQSSFPAELTDAFVKARYGHAEPAPDELARLKREAGRLN